MKHFRPEAPFGPSLFVDVRKRMGSEHFDRWQELVIRESEQFQPKKKKVLIGTKQGSAPVNGSPVNRGALKVDASVADQQVSFPTDLRNHFKTV